MSIKASQESASDITVRILKDVGKLAAHPDSSFTWYKAAQLSQLVQGNVRKDIKNLVMQDQCGTQAVDWL